jgi:hypothetical protein
MRLNRDPVATRPRGYDHEAAASSEAIRNRLHARGKRMLDRHARRASKALVLCAVLALSCGCASIEPTQAIPAGATAEATGPASVAQAPPDAIDEALESTRQSVRSTTEWLARGVDSWFGSKPSKDGSRVADGRLSVDWLHRRDIGDEFTLRFNANVRLPNLEERAYLFFGRNNTREVVTDKPDALSRQQRLQPQPKEAQSFFAGVGIPLRDRVDFRLGFRGGLKPYAQVRYRRLWEFGAADLIDFQESLFWSVDDRFGSTTAASFEHAFSATRALRWLNAATITQKVRKFEWSSSLGLHQSFGPRRVLSLEALVEGLQDSGFGPSDYGVRLKWEQPVHRDWLLGNAVVGHFWPRRDALSARESVWAVGGALILLF